MVNFFVLISADFKLFSSSFFLFKPVAILLCALAKASLFRLLCLICFSNSKFPSLIDFSAILILLLIIKISLSISSISVAFWLSSSIFFAFSAPSRFYRFSSASFALWKAWEFWAFLIKVFEIGTFSIPPFLMMKSFTSLSPSIVDSFFVNSWIFKRCLLIENPLSGSPFPWERVSTQLARATSAGNFFFPLTWIINHLKGKYVWNNEFKHCTKGELPECTVFVIAKWLHHKIKQKN